MAILLASCAGAPVLTPHFVDTDINACREYEVINPDSFIIKFKKDWPLAHCNGFFAIPVTEARAWKEFLLKKKSECNP